MNGPQAGRMILLAVMVTGLFTYAEAALSKEEYDIRKFAGIVIVGALLAILKEISPRLAGPFAALLLVTAIVNSSPKIWARLNTEVRK